MSNVEVALLAFAALVSLRVFLWLLQVIRLIFKWLVTVAGLRDFLWDVVGIFLFVASWALLASFLMFGLEHVGLDSETSQFVGWIIPAALYGIAALAAVWRPRKTDGLPLDGQRMNQVTK
jgi:hypothetical protein